MPDFDTRKPQEPNEPRRHRIALIADPLRNLSMASKRRILLMARVLRESLMANRRRILVIGGVFLCVMVAVPVGLLIYSSAEFDQAQQTGVQQHIRIDETQKSRLVFQLSGPYQTPSNFAISNMAANGSNLKQLTGTVDKRQMGYTSEDPARSPDLKKIAFTRVVSEFPASVDASASASARAGPSYIQVPYVYVVNADGSDETRLVDMAAAKPDWSPDGQQIVFSSDKNWTSSGVTDEGDCDLYVASADGSGTPRRLTNGSGCESNPSWSPDGAEITYTRDLGGDLDIYSIDACCEEGDTNEPQRLTDDDLDDTDPAWSPDGTKIAFTRGEVVSETNVVTSEPEDSLEADIYKMAADGSGETQITHSEAFEAQPTWSPDGKKIAFARQGFPGASPESDSMNATTGIFVMDSDGTDPALVRIFVNEIASFPEWAVTSQQDGITKQTNEDQPTEEAIADWRALDARLPDVAVQAYIEEIDELLRGVNPHDSSTTSLESSAEYMTLSVMKGLDPSGKVKIVQYLGESGLLTSIPLSGVDLSGVDLSGVNLSGATLQQTNLRGANLSNANLSGTYLYVADLRDADLSGANLSGADLTLARLDGVKLTEEQLEQTGPREGPAVPDEWQEKAWGAAARDAITDLAAAARSCAKQHGGSYADCVDFTELARYGLVVKPAVTYTAAPVSGAKSVVFKTEHGKGGLAYEFDSAAGGRIRPIPRFSL